jgi:glycosyltransferase involved in cell wall biosynthesis
VTALVPYKRVELALEAVRLRPRRLIVIGDGVERRRLQRLAPRGVEFTGWLPPERLRDYYRRCRALLFPGEEDFGIVPVEAQACGRPVVGFGCGGLLETVREGASGIFFREPTARALAEAMERCEGTRWDPSVVRAGVERFAPGRFEAEVDRWLREEGGAGAWDRPIEAAALPGSRLSGT